jgi:DNA-binding transcriptional ArsR family regulator
MGPQDIAKEAIRIATTAGLSKDVIDLLKEKIGLLTEQVTTLETENTNLKQKVANLEQEIEHIRPKQGGLGEDSERILKLLFDHGQSLSIEQIASAVGIHKGIAEYHRDVLRDARMIGPPGGVVYAGHETYKLLTKGRAFVVKNLFKK